MESALAVERVHFFKPELSLSPDEPRRAQNFVPLEKLHQLITLTCFSFQLSLINYSSN